MKKKLVRPTTLGNRQEKKWINKQEDIQVTITLTEKSNLKIFVQNIKKKLDNYKTKISKKFHNIA